jgi:putative DNA primase/helicase
MSGIKDYLFKVQESRLHEKTGSIDNDARKEYARLLGGEVDGDSIICPSPGRPPDDRSMLVRVNSPGRFFIYSCEGPDGRAYAFVRERLSLGPPEPRRDYSDTVLQILSEAKSATGTVVETYLRNRALTLPIPPCLRFHSVLEHKETSSFWPVMIAERTDVTGRVVALHRTYLARDGSGKARIDPQRKDLGPMKGTAIRLSPVAEELIVGEGIETTLSYIQMSGRPGWAAGSTAAMKLLMLPASVKTVIILADGDEPGERAARYSAKRWLREGRRVKIIRAPPGKDFNDVLQESARNV